ncbi:MAG: hypothetical protein M0R28_20250 [Pigmentiphaga sp.]|nr:hypothetical protein [Pigmentiphaga sp.]
MANYTKARILTGTGNIEVFDIHAFSFSEACRQALQIVDKLARKTCFHVRVVEVCK